MHESTREDCELFARVISVGVESVSGATDLRLGRERVTLLEREGQAGGTNDVSLGGEGWGEGRKEGGKVDWPCMCVSMFKVWLHFCQMSK